VRVKADLSYFTPDKSPTELSSEIKQLTSCVVSDIPLVSMRIVLHVRTELSLSRTSNYEYPDPSTSEYSI